MRFITLQRPDGGVFYLNVNSVITIVPSDAGAKICVSTGGICETSNSVAEVFERMREAEDIALDGVDSVDIDLEGV